MDGDVIAWDPAVLAPGLAAGSTVRFTPRRGTPAEVRASDGQPIMTQQVVTLVDVQSARGHRALARLLNPIAHHHRRVARRGPGKVRRQADHRGRDA
ncbi:hypothetical protein GS831_24130 [Rhodococcus hoagii]|nr:hypothetical protein [Prescottella equi]